MRKIEGIVKHQHRGIWYLNDPRWSDIILEQSLRLDFLYKALSVYGISTNIFISRQIVVYGSILPMLILFSVIIYYTHYRLNSLCNSIIRMAIS